MHLDRYGPALARLAAGLVAVGLLGLAAPAQAGSIEYLTNQSADYIRSFSRNAATDGVDAAIYNPAGTAWLADGLYFGLSSQALLGEYRIEDDGKEYPADVFVPSLPSLQVVYKRDSLAAFGSFSVPAGGGSLTYAEGVPYLVPLVSFVDGATEKTPKNGEFSGSSIFYGGSLGVAWRFRDLVSFGLTGRMILGTKAFDGFADYGAVRAELHAKKQALGFGAAAGLHVRPIPQVELGLRYELETPLEFEAETTAKGMYGFETWKGKPLESYADGAKEKRNLPAVLGVGLAAHPIARLHLSVSGHYYFIEAADDAKDERGAPGTGLGSYVRSYDDDYENGWDLAGSLEYDVLPTLLLSAGYIRAQIGGNADTYGDFEYALDSNSVGLGGRYSLLDDRLRLTLGLSRTVYIEGKNDPITAKGIPAFMLAPNGETFNKNVWDLALGAAWRF